MTFELKLFLAFVDGQSFGDIQSHVTHRLIEQTYDLADKVHPVAQMSQVQPGAVQILIERNYQAGSVKTILNSAGWHKGRTTISHLQRFQGRTTLFTHGREVAAYGGKLGGAGQGAETAGYFLFDLHHPQVALGLVVVEGDAEVVHKGEDFWAVVTQPVKQIAWRRLFGATACGRPFWGWIEAVPFLNESRIALFEAGDALGGQVILNRAGLFNREVDFAQQVSHFFSPGLLILLVGEG